jgi:tRNA modification GTPase
VKNRVLDLSTTIFALSSGKLPSAIAVVRLSGPLALSITEKLTGSGAIRARGMYRLAVRAPQGEYIDDCMVLSFPGPASFTGQDVVEFQCHGSIPVVEKLEQTLFALGAIPAEKGKFSYRAYINGKLASPPRVEKLADVYLAKDTSDLKSIYLRFDEATEAESFSHARNRDGTAGDFRRRDRDFSEEYLPLRLPPLPPL